EDALVLEDGLDRSHALEAGDLLEARRNFGIRVLDRVRRLLEDTDLGGYDHVYGVTGLHKEADARYRVDAHGHRLLARPEHAGNVDVALTEEADRLGRHLCAGRDREQRGLSRH